MPERSQKKLQYSLRGMAIAVAALCIWLGLHAQKARQQAAARRQLLEHDAQVLYDHEIAGEPPPKAPAALRGLLGEDFFATVVRVNFHFGALPDEGKCLSALGGLPGVTVINIEDAPIDAAHLAHLEGADLECLRLIKGGIGDDALRHLAGLKRLTMLDLSGNPISDAGLAHLANLDNLEYLTLQQTAVTDDGLKHLARLKKLKHLNVQESQVTKAAANDLSNRIPGLQVVGGK